VRLGEHDERTNPDCSPDDGCAEPTQDVRVEWAVTHPSYRSASFRNDIGIIKLQQSVNFTSKCLMQSFHNIVIFSKWMYL
jgi:Trypsin